MQIRSKLLALVAAIVVAAIPVQLDTTASANATLNSTASANVAMTQRLNFTAAAGGVAVHTVLNITDAVDNSTFTAQDQIVNTGTCQINCKYRYKFFWASYNIDITGCYIHEGMVFDLIKKACAVTMFKFRHDDSQAEQHASFNCEVAAQRRVRHAMNHISGYVEGCDTWAYNDN